MNRLELNLPARSFISTSDLEELHRAISPVVEPPRFSFLGPQRNTQIDISRLALRESQIFGVKTGSSVRVTNEVCTAVHVTIPLQGAIQAFSGGTERRIGPGEALVQLAGEPNNLVRLGDCTTVFVRVEQRFLTPLMPECRSAANWRPAPGLHVLPLRDGLGQALINLVDQICSETWLLDAESIRDHELDKVLNYVLALIVTQNRFVELSEHEDYPKSPRYLDRAVDFVQQNLEQNLSLGDLTAVAHMSARTLQRAFMRKFGKGPLSYIKHAKLDKVREEFLNFSPHEKSVSQVAAKWGFHHAGNFAKAYSEAFDETPRITLQRLRPGPPACAP